MLLATLIFLWPGNGGAYTSGIHIDRSGLSASFLFKIVD